MIRIRRSTAPWKVPRRRSERGPGGLQAAQREFRRAHPAYARTALVDALRARVRPPRRGGHVYLDYTGGGLYAESQLRDAPRPAARRVLGNPHSPNPTSPAATGDAERARAAVLAYFDASPDEYDGRLHAQRERRAQAGRRGLPVRAGRPLPAHRRQPQLGQRHPRVRPRARRVESPTCRSLPRRPARSTRRELRALLDSLAPGRAQSVRLSGPVQLLAASSTRSSGSGARRRAAGTCCSTRPRSRRPTGSTCAASGPTSSPSRSTRCSATRPASAA